ncbi:signal transduction histidine kinase/purine-cytosine permease-like protein [Amaricoccus macauensis]|uniref:histidine kinase n=1 Tax=Amaricoccus macauensis TaxID=57001 RepID=A0A840SYN6_9RHOB|nr:ATP-binding protein [Amaricoccus macauensis]MBB5224182.1 signal transduction histidine kinase/purine-cytosine permease-like protein [Amaricoccus macauensis]
MSRTAEQRPAIRSYRSWVANETLEDYALRYAARSFRRWTPFVIANTALGGIAFLALETIGGVITLRYGFANAIPAIVCVSLFIFVTSLPIAYYSSRYNIDMDLLTRAAGFGYIGSTITSLIYATFTIIFFALEGAIMAQAMRVYADVPIVIGYVVSSFVIIPLTAMGVTVLSRLQMISQPLWIIMLVAPFLFILAREPGVLAEWSAFTGAETGFSVLAFGGAIGVLCSLTVQVGEQVDYLRFLPDLARANRRRWWVAMLSAGPGWIVVGGLKMLGGSLLAVMVLSASRPAAEALEPIHMFALAYGYIFANPETALAAATVFVLVSQIKINVTNAYAGSLAWSNFFSRVTHYHPGRVAWLVFNILISLLLMLLGIFDTLELVLAVYGNIATAWLGSLVADLAILKPLRISPAVPEFKRAYLRNFNPVGCGSMALASVVGLSCYAGVAGPMLQAWSAPLAFVVALASAVLIGVVTRGQTYLARPIDYAERGGALVQCRICDHAYEKPDMAFCPFYDGPICSLCCSLDTHCHDVCKAPSHGRPSVAPGNALRQRFALRPMQRVAKVTGVTLVLWTVSAAVFLLTYRMADLHIDPAPYTNDQMLLRVFVALLPLLGIGAWWIVLSHESRELAERELVASLEELRETQAELARTERLAAIGTLTASVSHELRNPLGALANSVDVLDRSLPAEAREGPEFTRIRRSVQRCSRIIDELLDFSRRRESAFAPLAVDRWLAAQVGEHAAAALVELDLGVDCTIEADAELMRQAVVNLLDNARHAVIEAHPEGGGRIVVRTRADASTVVLSVSDNGVGLSEAERKRVFEPLYSTKAYGVGLGMSVVQRVVTVHGGRIELGGRPGEGTTIALHIPRQQSGPADAR